ncbi:MAG: NgoMIV family type II restriction endonuclease [Phaeodactylibacter sp.]|uniref:NgoMIV family type II restriction endonuclease n=1 Tax=Phaeodactylibacter sp. TaxID=1940289 RepID=UPI0032ECFCFE
MSQGYLSLARSAFHQELLDQIIHTDQEGVPNFADSSQLFSREVARHIYSAIGGKLRKGRLSGQTLGNQFELITSKYIEETFLKLGHLRPGNWTIEQIRSRSSNAIARFEQYTHLIDLKALADSNQVLAAALGNDYAISPDIVVLREPEEDDSINRKEILVDRDSSKQSTIRKIANAVPVLHASISCKWTLRSDRAQNARSEALNLLRNRKGRSPHIVILTAEPTPSRISSIALGTGDIDCVYHFALYELQEAVRTYGNDDNNHLLDIMIEGKRLKDISDLPLDLAV